MANAKNGKHKVNAALSNSAAMLAASHDEMVEFGKLAVLGKGAKTNAVKKFRADCLANLANASMVDTYVGWYIEGMKAAGGRPLNGNGLAVFKSQLAVFADSKVIASYDAIESELEKLHGAKDKRVSRATTDKDRFGQLVAVGQRIRSEGAPVKVNADYIVASVAKKEKSSAEIDKLAKQSLVDSANTLLGTKPNPKLVEARNTFFKLLKIEIPTAA